MKENKQSRFVLFFLAWRIKENIKGLAMYSHGLVVDEPE
jgi:hypothetical protein